MTFAGRPRSLNVNSHQHKLGAWLVGSLACVAAVALYSGTAGATCVYTNPDAPLTLPDLNPPVPTANDQSPPAKPAPIPAPAPAPAGPGVGGPGFAYYPPGELNSHDKGRGRVGDRKIYLPDIIFPVRLQPGLETTPPGKHAFMNSQIWGYGGGGYAGKGAAGGTESDGRNFDPMINRDDYCEVRSWSMPLCPAGSGHQGQDIRPPSYRDAKDDAKWEVQAVVDGIVTLRTSNTTVVLKGGDGTEYYYLHMHPDSIAVKVGQAVKQGDLMGRISNFMNGGRDTTHHLHFQVMQSIRINGVTKRVYVPVFASLISAYRKAKGLDGAVGPDGTLLVDPTHEYDAAGKLQPISPGGGSDALQTADLKFISYPIPNLKVSDGRALPPLSVAQYFKPKSASYKVKYTAVGLPTGLSIDANTGAIKGMIEPGASKRQRDGNYTVAITADDGAGETMQQSFVMTAQTSPPEIGTATRGKFFKDGSWVLIDAGAAFLNPSVLTLTYSAEGLPPGVSINPATGRIAGRLSKAASQASNNGIYTVTVIAAASTGTLRDRIINAVEGNPLTVKERFTVTAEPQKDPNTVVPDVPLPVVTAALASVKAYDGQGITTINASGGFKAGGDGTGRLTYAAVSLPLALSIDPQTGIIGGTMDPNASKGGTGGSYTVTVIADNGEGGTASQSFVITSRNQGPVLATPTVNKVYAEGEPVEISVGSAFSSPDPASVTYTASGLPTGLALDRKSGVIAGTMPDGASKGGVNGVYTVLAAADDGKGGKATETFTITATLRAVPPVAFGQLSPVTATEGGAFGPIDVSTAFKAGSAASGLLSYNALGLPPALVIDKASGQISGTIAAGASAAVANGTYPVTVIATDPKSGLNASQTITLKVTAPPVPEPPPSPPVAPEPPAQPANQPQDTPQPEPPKPQPVPPTIVAGFQPVNVQEGSAITPLNTAVAFQPGGASSGPLSYAAKGLPAGLSIDPASGQLSGTVATGAVSIGASQNYNATVTATDTSNGLSSLQALTIVVQALPPQPPPPPPTPQPEPPAVTPPPPPAPQTWTGWAWAKISGTASSISTTVSDWWTKKK